MATFTCHNGEVPEGMEVTQVYGVIFTKDGRILLMSQEKAAGRVYSLSGGTPEDFDKSKEETLRRELFEEVNVTIEKPIMLGYQEVDEENGRAPYAQVRMAAIIDNIGPSRPDPDNGKTYDRILTSPERAIELLNWGETGRLQIEEAVRIAKEQLGITKFSDKEEFINKNKKTL